jgi:hypothetical protein
MFFVRRSSLYLSLANVIIPLRSTQGTVVLLAGGVLHRLFLVNFKIPLLTASDVVGVVNETVLEFTRSRLPRLGHLLLTLSDVVRSLGLRRLLLLKVAEVVLLHGLELHFVLVTLGGLARSATHFVEGINVPLGVFQELVDVLAEHFFKIAVLHADLARLFSLLSADHGNLLLLSVSVGSMSLLSVSVVGLVGGVGAASRHGIVETVVNRALTVGIEASNVVSKGSELT